MTRTEQLATDKRILALSAAEAALRPDHAYGMFGARQVFTGLGSGATGRRARIGRLIFARIGQIDGNHAKTARGLAEAANIRKY